MHHSPRPWIALGLALVAATGAGSQADADSNATITASFADSCRDFSAHASKDISHVVIHYADDRVVKDESIDNPDYALDGAAGDEIATATVKAAQSVEMFECRPSGSPPVALLETRVCQLGLECQEWTSSDSPGTVGQCSHERSDIPFRAINSADADDDIVTWSIEFGDGSPPATGTWAGSPPTEVRHVFVNVSGLHTLNLLVTDGSGQTGADTILICVIDQSPD